MDINEALRDIQTIRTVAAGLTRKRDGVYVLMTEIYRIGRKWHRSGQAREFRNAVMQHEKIQMDRRVRKQIFRFLIEVGWSLEIGQSRYANALRYAQANNCPPAELTIFLKSRGGIEACDNLFRAQRKLDT